MASLNSCINPIALFVVSKRFQRCFKVGCLHTLLKSNFFFHSSMLFMPRIIRSRLDLEVAKAASSSSDELSYVSSKAHGVMSVKDLEGATTWGLNKCRLYGEKKNPLQIKDICHSNSSFHRIRVLCHKRKETIFSR